MNQTQPNTHASITKYTTTYNEPKNKDRFGRLLRPPAWKRNVSILEGVDK